MAAPSTHQYNLHSCGHETVQLPVELHMAEDSTFMKDLASQQPTVSGQVSDNESSINDSDCEALIAILDDNHYSLSEGISHEKSVKNLDPTVSDSQSISQQAFNIQILAQL